MPKQWLKKISPHPDKIKKNKLLRLLGKLIDASELWHFNRHSVSRAFALGLFWALIPIPFQMIPSVICALIFRANIPLSIGLVWITNPLTIPIIFYATYKVGTFILNVPNHSFHIELDWAWLSQQIHHVWKPLFLGSFICASIVAFIAYFSVKVVWRIWLVRRWKHRQRRYN